ncbi:MAG TPA: hypothetical protein VG944_21915 [Fimbriimonas sp.]|nr:hypothetical protein [Fimbriimonas sp.]
MKEFNELSGPWTGLSVQDGIRISEQIRLTIHAGQISGSGTDKDGEFELSGFYKQRTQQVMLTRRYTRTTEPSQENVGIAYDYEGVWDGAMVSGRWHPRMHPSYGGPFEMWPSRDTDLEELTISFEETKLLALPGGVSA